MEFKPLQTIRDETTDHFEKNNKLESLQLKEEGNHFMKQLKYKLAIKCYHRACSADPTNPVLFTNLCLAQMKMCDFQGARKSAERSISIDPEWVKGYYFLGTIHFTLCNYQEAHMAFQFALSKDRKNNQVVDYIKRVEDRITRLREHPFRLAILQRSMSNEFEKKFEMEIIGKTARDTSDPYALWKLAQDAVEREKYREALAYYHRLVDLNLSDQNYYVYIMFCHIMLNENDKSVKYLDKVESPVWIEYLGKTLFQHLSEYAVPFFEKSIELGAGDNLEFFSTFLGLCYLAGNHVKQDFEKSKKYFQMAKDAGIDDLELTETVHEFLKSNPSVDEIKTRISDNPHEELPLYAYLAERGDADAIQKILEIHQDDPETQKHLYRDLVAKGHYEHCEILARIHVKDGEWELAQSVMNLIE